MNVQLHTGTALAASQPVTLLALLNSAQLTIASFWASRFGTALAKRFAVGHSAMLHGPQVCKGAAAGELAKGQQQRYSCARSCTQWLAAPPGARPHTAGGAPFRPARPTPAPVYSLRLLTVLPEAVWLPVRQPEGGR